MTIRTYRQLDHEVDNKCECDDIHCTCGGKCHSEVTHIVNMDDSGDDTMETCKECARFHYENYGLQSSKMGVMNNSNIVFKSEIKTASTERLQDRLDTLIRATERERKEIGILNLIEETGNIEAELSKRNALYPVYPFAKFGDKDWQARQ